MTREEVLAMEPGRELNMLVAEKVMGLTVIVERRPDGATWVKEVGKELYDLPNYSTDISAAWEVLEHLKNKGAEINVGFFTYWDCAIDYPIGCNWRAEAETAPEAICKAALLAVMDLPTQD